MSPTIVSLLAAVTATMGVIAAYQVTSDVFLRDRSRVTDRIDEEFLRKRKDRAKKSPLFKNLGQMAHELGAGDDDRPTLKQRFAAMVEQSGMDVTPGRIGALSGMAAAALGAVGFLLRRSPLDAALAAAVGAAVPVWVVKQRRDKRIEKLRSQLPEAFDLMARIVRAGQTLGQALLAVADEFPQPISGEFAYCYEQQNLGLPPEVTFRDLNRRTGIIELKIFVLAVLIQQQTGGNLAELLIKLAEVVRDRYKIRGTIRTLTAEGRAQGWILAAVPPLMLVVLLVVNREYAGVLFEHPRVLFGTFGLEVVGTLCIRKIVNFEF
jgi:tight adherence protein B